MPATLSALLAHAGLAITPVTAIGDGEAVIRWAHGSDLADPSPFLSPGQLLLTTGLQFADDAGADDYLGYVTRVVAAGVVALGFGTEVVRDGTPPLLVEACATVGVPLVEVPYRTPFIAVSRWVAEVESREARARVDWALATQGAVSQAALGRGGLPAAVARAAERLGCDIAVFDADVEVTVSRSASGEAPPGRFASAGPEAARLLRGALRARTELELDGDHVSVQTLGGSGRLRGILVFARQSPFDSAELSAMTTLVALAEVSLEHSQDLRISLRSLMVQLFALLRDGRVDSVRKAIAEIPAGLPDRTLVVVALRLEEVGARLRDSLERRAALPASRLFVVESEGQLVLLAGAERSAELRRFLGQSVGGDPVRAGVSDPVGWDALGAGLVQATRALEASPPASITDFAGLVASSFLGLLSSASVAEMARGRLAPLLATDGGLLLLREAATWLRHNGQWDPAARELGMHRHSLRIRITRLERALDLTLDRFEDRAELWALLASIDLAAAGAD